MIDAKDAAKPFASSVVTEDVFNTLARIAPCQRGANHGPDCPIHEIGTLPGWPRLPSPRLPSMLFFLHLGPHRAKPATNLRDRCANAPLVNSRIIGPDCTPIASLYTLEPAFKASRRMRYQVSPCHSCAWIYPYGSLGHSVQARYPARDLVPHARS